MKSRKLNRKSNRLRDYDYSTSGYYYVTICTKDREEFFGAISNEYMILNKYGGIAKNKLKEIPKHYENIDIDLFIIMPNHIHGIIVINDNNYANVGTEQCSVPTKENRISSRKNYGLLSKTVKSFKDAVTKDIKLLSGKDVKLWQRSFYDHIIRSEESLDEIRRYINENPLKWALDENNPDNLK